MSSCYDPEAAEEWINKVNLVQQTIKDLGSNKANALKNADDLLSKFKREKEKKIVKQKQKRCDTQRYRKGDGWKNEYKLYCNHCFTEIMIKISSCPRCGYDTLITRTSRRDILQKRVNTLKKEYELKEIRRARWETYRKVHAKHEYHMTNYTEWELWEDEIDWEDYMDPNYIPSDNASARAMALDMQQRSQKRKDQMKAAIKAKNSGNKYLKEKKYSLAVQYYTAAIEHRRDYKALYTNRALALMKLGRYDKCISDCTIVIDMISHIDSHEKRSDIIFKAYLRRANAYQLLGKLSLAKEDITRAIDLRPKQKDALKMCSVIQQLVVDEEMREKIQKEILNDNALTNFDNALKLLLDYFGMKHPKVNTWNKTPFEKKINEWNSEKASLLFTKLLNLISLRSEYAVRFADSNGLYLGFTYLESELLDLQNEIINNIHNQMSVDLNNKQHTLSKCCKLLIYTTSYKHNIGVIERDSSMIKSITSCIYYIMSSFEQYNDALSIHSVHLSSICCEMKPIRDFIANNDSYSCLFYKNINEYLLYSPPNPSKLQILQYLFDFLENLFSASEFIKTSINSSDDPHIYIALFNHLTNYMDYVHSARMGQDEMMKFEIKQCVVSSILTALATLFGPNQSVIDILMKDSMLTQRLSILKTHLIALNRMFIQFEERNPLKNINHLPTAMSKEQTEQVLAKLYEKHQLNISQIAKVITVFMSLSHHRRVHKVLIKLEIHQLLFDLLPFVRFIDYKNSKYANILSLARDHIINYFDQISNNTHFDVMIDKYNKDCGYNKELLPPFWTFITDIINRRSFINNNNNNNKQQQRIKSKHNKKHKKHNKKHKKHKKHYNKNTKNDDKENYDDMEVDAQSGSIRILTRWIRRRLPDDTKETTKRQKEIDDDDDDNDIVDIVRDEFKKNNKRNNGNYTNRGSDCDNRVIDILLIKHYSNIFKYIKYCSDPHVLANAPLLLKQFIIYAKLNEKNKPHLKQLIKKQSKNQLKDLMALFSSSHVSIIQNSVTCMAQLATFDEDLRDKIREMGGLKAMSQLHMQHRHQLFK